VAERRSVAVCADWVGLGGPTAMGTLHATPSRGKEIFSFEYDGEWLSSGLYEEIDPVLRHYRGPQFAGEHRDNFGLLLDSSPDRWGRVLMRRREALIARREGRAERKLSELDYLLGVFDGHRMGALRFRIEDGPFLDDDQELASPPWTSLRELEAASIALERDDAEDDPRYGTWLRMLLAPGRSLGGARPKASVIDPKHALWIAKFPSSGDTTDIGAWEGVVHRLARRAGVVVSEGDARRFTGDHHTFLTRRFDRRDGARVHFASAMTLLDRRDGDEGGSYLELADVLIRSGANAPRDLEELWRRIVFFIMVSNVDDHLRNHGFLLEPRGWALAPAYDMNPVATGDGLTLNISETDNAQDLDLARSVASSFRVKPRRAAQIIDGVREVVASWRSEAAAFGISRGELDRMASAFRVAV
jgi:serine/threonine-protein kinase HipA